MKYQELENTSKPYIVSLVAGDEINKSIKKFCLETKIKAASFHGIGAVRNVEVAIFDPITKKYTHKKYKSNYEMTSLLGNYSYINNHTDHDDWFVHSHITFTDSEFNCFGGHLVEAEVCAVAEIFLIEYFNPNSPSRPLVRKYSDDIGLNVFQLPI